MDLIKIENGQLDQMAVDFIINIETQMKTLKQQYDEFKSKLQNAMEQNGIVKFENENLRINYFAEQTGIEVFNKDQFKEDMPDLYDEYCTLDGKKKAYIKIAVRK